MIDNKKIIYAGIGVFVLLVIYNSTKKPALVEVKSLPTSNNFDASQLPSHIKPPVRLYDGQPIPAPVKKSITLNMIGVYPRFDT
jgi:hypothetical protein